MTAPVNGTDERLDVIAALLSEILAELRQANAPTTINATDTGEKPVGAKRTRKG